MAMPHICEELAQVLQTVQRPGDFYASGRLEISPPRMVVEGVGEISLPLLPVQAEQLIALADRAPYGRGPKTLIDTSVRRTWQIQPQRARFLGKGWQTTVERATALAAELLGVDEPVSAELYKLLMYDKGSFFVSHRDTEKAPGMFATLVLALPSICSGGELVVRHQDREARLDLANDDPGLMAFAAFYADCVHEVLPITAGYRATLVYNLTRQAREGRLVPPNYEAEAARVRELLRGWAEGGTVSEEEPPEKVIYPLEHAYSPAELGFGTLKGVDAAVAGLLDSVAPQAGCDLHLALVSIKETGSAEQVYSSYRSRYRRHDSEEFEVLEVHERSEHLKEWRRADGEPVALGEIPVEAGELSPPDAFEDMEPDEEHFHEATGNEGASFDRTYYRAALVLWPRQRRLAVINQAGPQATLPYLETLATRWVSEGARRDSELWREAHELSGHVLDTWREVGWYGSTKDDEDDPKDDGAPGVRQVGLARLLATLTVFKDEERIQTAIKGFVAQRGHYRSDNAAILGALALLPPQQAAGIIEGIIAAHASLALGPSCGLLRAAITGAFADKPQYLATAARTLVALLPGDPETAPVDAWGLRRHLTPGPGVIADLVQITEAIDDELARQVAQHVLAWPKTYSVDRALVPAVKRLLDGGVQRPGAALSSLLPASLAHLKKRAAEPLQAPRNWARASNVRCSCEHCRALRRFLASPDTQTWTLRAAERVRSHVQDKIREAGADLDVTTERRGSPHSLICQKNSASYERRVAQRRQDLADIAVLRTTARYAASAKPRSQSRRSRTTQE